MVRIVAGLACIVVLAAFGWARPAEAHGSMAAAASSVPMHAIPAADLPHSTSPAPAIRAAALVSAPDDRLAADAEGCPCCGHGAGCCPVALAWEAAVAPADAGDPDRTPRVRPLESIPSASLWRPPAPDPRS